jgi:small-conductance mechanosensitive channel
VGAVPAPVPGPVTVPLIVGRAEEALAKLTSMATVMREDPELERVARALPSEERIVARIRSARASGVGVATAERDMDELEREVARAEHRLASLQGALDVRAEQFQLDSTELARLRAVWAATAAAPDTLHAPERLRQRVAEVNERISALEVGADGYLGRLVDLQDRTAQIRAELGATAAALQQARRTLERQLFEVESTPLWRAFGTAVTAGEEARRGRATARTHLRSVGEYLRSGDLGMWGQLASWAALAAALAWLRRARGGTAAHHPGEATVLRHPVLAAAVATVVLTPLFQPRVPLPMLDAAILAAVVPWLLVSRHLLPRRLLAPQLALTALFAMERFVAFAPAHALSARLALLATSAGGVALLASGLRRSGWASELDLGAWRSAARAALWAALALLGIAVVANVMGNVTLATRLTRGTLSSALGGVVASCLALVARAAIGAILQLAAMRGRRIIALHGPLLERRCRQVVDWVAFALWAYLVAASFRVTGRTVALASAILRRPLSVGSLRVSLGDLVAFGVTLWIAIVLSRLVRFVLDEGVLPAMPLGRGVPGAISKTAQYAVMGLGTLAALYASGLELGKFSLFAGTLGVGIGFGLQNVVNNFVSGLILLYERPVQPGDIIDVGGVSGEVRRIGVRSSTVRTFQGADVIVPNATLISAEVVNWTLTDRTRRVEVAVSVAYGSDPDVVRRILLDAVQRDDVLRDPEPVVLLMRFAESALDFEVRFWPARFETWVVVASEVRATVLRELTRAGITIPFPQRDVHVHSGVDLSLASERASAGGPRRR